MSVYKVGDLRLEDKFLWWPMRYNGRWHWWKKVCIMKQLTLITVNGGPGTIWVTIKVMEFPK
jgi:hypothetical protein